MGYGEDDAGFRRCVSKLVELDEASKLTVCVLRTRCRCRHILVGYDGNGGVCSCWNEDSQIRQRKTGEQIARVESGSS